MSWSIGRWSTKRPGQDWPLESVFRRVVDQHRVALNILGALTTRPGHDTDLPLVGCPDVGDCREFSCAGYCSEASESSADFQRGQRIGSVEPPAEGAGHPPRSPSAGPTWVDWATPAIMTVLAAHTPQVSNSDSVYCIDESSHIFCEALTSGDWQDWREHVAPLIAAHLEDAHKLNVRDGLDCDCSTCVSGLFPQFRKR